MSSMRIRAGSLAGTAMLIAVSQSATAGTQIPAPEVRLATTWRDVADVRLYAAA